MRSDYDEQVRVLCQQLIEAADPAAVERISHKLRLTIRQQVEDARQRIHEVAPILPVRNNFPKAS
jgi:hypothetical protein